MFDEAAESTPILSYHSHGDDTFTNTLKECLHYVDPDASVSRHVGGRLDVMCGVDLGRAYRSLESAAFHLGSLFQPNRLVIEEDGRVIRLLRLSASEPVEVIEAAAALLRRSLLDRVECFATDPREDLACDLHYRVSLLPLIGCDESTPPLEIDFANNTTDSRYVTSDDIKLPQGVSVAHGRFALAKQTPGRFPDRVSFDVERGDGNKHVRFRSVTRVSISENFSGHVVCIEGLVGQLTYKECVDGALLYISKCAMLCVDVESHRPHTLTSAGGCRFSYIVPVVDAADEPCDEMVPIIECGVSEDLHRQRKAYGEAMVATNRGHRLRDAANDLAVALDTGIAKFGFVSRAVPKLTQIVKEYGIDLHRAGELRVAVLCEGPGSFTQWLLYNTQHHLDVEIYGFTLQGNQNDEFRMGPVRGRELPLRFFDMSGHSGDITNPYAAQEFTRGVGGRISGSKGVHIVTADGGLPDTILNQDEANTLALIASEMAVALALLEQGGDFVCKMFLTETPPMVRLLQQASECFDRVDLIKPLASRTTNSEKYFIGRCFRDTAKGLAWARGLWNTLALVEMGSPGDVKGAAVAAHLSRQGGVPRPFSRFLYHANTEMGRRQAASLKESLGSLPADGSQASRVLRSERGGGAAETCLWLWGLVDSLTGRR